MLDQEICSFLDGLGVDKMVGMLRSDLGERWQRDPKARFETLSDAARVVRMRKEIARRNANAMHSASRLLPISTALTASVQ